jgi:acyl dehydratase
MLDSATSSGLEDLAVGATASFGTIVTAAAIDAFADVSGDHNPLHTDATFARSRGQAGRVAHGAYLVALVSRLVGTALPGRDALLLAVNMSFVAPVLVDTTICVTGIVEQASAAVRSIVVGIRITDAGTGALLARGRATVGLTVDADA